MKQRIASGLPGSILIAGTAGDGKTYHCRSLWTSLGGNPRDWDDPSLVKKLPLSDGRCAIFVKDLSELSDELSDDALGLLERSVLGSEDSEFLVVAANHGQILERLRDLGFRQGRVHPLRKPVQDFFLLSGQVPDRLAIYDLSKTAHRQSLEEVLSAIAGHPEWDSCIKCSLQSAGRICPIFENRERLLGANDGGRFVRRLGDLVEVARLNGWHLPVRDLLALAANMILGHSDAREGLMACGDVARHQDAGTAEHGNLYDNTFGVNLSRRRALDRPVFKALASFGIGEETSNGADGLLVYGADDQKLANSFFRLVGSDPIYGATPSYLAAQQHYLEGEETARLENGAAEFLGRLAAQRRRLFFTLPETETDYPFWEMTAFRFAGDYLDMTVALALVERKPVNETVRARIVRGLNRVMTGLLIENTDRIFVASSGGFTQSKISVLCDTEAPSRRLGGIGMSIRPDAQTGSPTLDIALAQGSTGSVTFNLSPVRFEFLCRVAEGSLPGSFSNECLEDMLAFKAKLLRKAELLRALRQNEDEVEPGEEDGALTLSFIEIEQNGHAFSRPVTVRIGS
ncbi:MAG: hypothetical protein PHH47_00415 [Gallionella sp.]|nr:hypothetical protein [Gallionella sp.]MDD4947402.1 hypothetical protein [Gallionella sp.]MDO9054325.1 hypothetical protein [Gallionella sp.]MDP1939210.1 hypothetical protein [Gallionella sp.]